MVGKPGRRIVESLLPGIREEHHVDFVVANGENAAGGRGLTPGTAQELLDSGVDVITSGNHIWNHREIYDTLDEAPNIIRPVNYPPGVPGKGICHHKGVTVINAIGRTFMGEFDDPFRAIDALLDDSRARRGVICVDFHAEATSEKQAMGWYLDGRVGAVVGTHTHVPTADPKILANGTAYVTDVGMAGPMDSIIGVEPEAVIERFLTQIPNRFPVATGRAQLNSVLIEIDEETGRASKIERIDREQAASRSDE